LPCRLYKAILFVLGITAVSNAAGQNPVVSPSPQIVFLNYTSAAPPPDPQVITLTTDTGTAILSSASIIYMSNGPTGWLSVAPSGSLTTPADLSIYADPTGLAAGTYIAEIQLNFGSTVDPLSQTAIPVFLTVTGAGSGGGGGTAAETVSASPMALAFAWQVGDDVPASQSLSVSSSDNAGINVTAITNDGNPWLSASSSAIKSPGTVDISVDPTSLTAGAYTGTITLQAPNAIAQVAVTLTVTGAGVTISPASLTFNVPQSYGFSVPQYLNVDSVSGPATFTAFGNSEGNWLVVDTPSATTPASVAIRVNAGSLPQGTYQGAVIVETASVGSAKVPVILTVGPPAVLRLQPASLSFSYRIGDPAPGAQAAKIDSNTTTPQTFSASASTTDGALWLRAAAGPSTTPGLVSVGVDASALMPGSYTGIVSVTPTSSAASPQPIIVTLTVLPALQPAITTVVSSASLTAGPVAPGEFVMIFGSTLGPTSSIAPPPGVFPTSLGGTTVMFDGIPAPMFYASSGQLSVQVPYGIATGQTSLTVSRNGATSPVTNLPTAADRPTLFTANTSGRGQAAALNQDFSANSSSHPAARGSAIVLYGTGEGKTNPVSVEGTFTSSTPPFPRPPYPVAVSFGGVPAVVWYAGETPGAVSGLMQINATVPVGAPAGPAVPVVVTINGQSSQGNVTVAIQ
jgi:uncharacterized protein (TIGR03437 family)